MAGDEKIVNVDAILSKVQSKLAEHGIEINLTKDLAGACCHPGDGSKVKVVCVSPDLKDTVEEMGHSPRDRVVMVRVDDDTSKSLDAWVETGAVKSRSEAAALFIREGLKVRAAELDQLKEALNGVEEARDRLREKAKEVFGDGMEPGA
ncbi:MAG: ribbon-helix-helix domain-containing protein [Planctomycetota bacterium]|jgi:hypothetical protein